MELDLLTIFLKKYALRSIEPKKLRREEEMKFRTRTGCLPGRFAAPSFKSLRAMVLVLFFVSTSAFAQYATKWMDVGAFQSWYSNAGCEYEEGRVLVQQDGDRWPAIYPNQDMEAAKGLWIGVKNFKDASGTIWPIKVVHFGPEV